MMRHLGVSDHGFYPELLLLLAGRALLWLKAAQVLLMTSRSMSELHVFLLPSRVFSREGFLHALCDAYLISSSLFVHKIDECLSAMLVYKNI